MRIRYPRKKISPSAGNCRNQAIYLNRSSNLFYSLLVFFFLFTATSPTKAQCISTGAMTASTFTNDGSNGGNFSFSNPLFAQLSDASRATASAIISILSGSSNYLKVTNFNASVPVSGTICGIELNLQKSATGINILTSVSDGEIKLVQNGSIVGNNKAVGGKWPTSDAYFTYGGSGDMWGTTLTPADVNASNFGFVISADLVGVLALLPSARINYVELTVYYTVHILPITLTSFEVSKKNTATHHFSWSVQNQQDVAKYEIQYANDAINWHPIYETTPTAPGKYDVELPAEHATKNYYRLLIRSKDGSYQYSSVKMVGNNPANSTQVIVGSATLDIKNVAADGYAVLIDSQGRLISQKKVSPGNLNQVDISTLAKGIYLLKVADVVERFIKL